MTSKADLALEHVHNLYLMQWKLLDLLDQELGTPAARKAAKQDVREFMELLRKADHRYMGGEDVWQALESLPGEIEMKLKGGRK